MPTARDETLRAIAARLNATKRAEYERRAIQQPAQYAGQRTVKSLGAAGGVPIRTSTSTAGLAIGEPVSVAQGVLSGQQDAPPREALANAVARLERAIAEVASRRGIVVVAGDPNTIPAYQLYNYQIAYDSTNETLYYWNPGIVGTAGSWVEIVLPGGAGGGPATVFSPDPPTVSIPAPNDGDRWYDTTTQREWIYSADDLTYYPAGSKNFHGLPSSDPNAFADGDRTWNRLNLGGVPQNVEWQWSAEDGEWHVISCCDYAAPPGDPPETGCDPGTFYIGDLLTGGCTAEVPDTG